MEAYRADKHQIDKPSKIVIHPDGYEVINNDGTIKVALQRTTVMNDSMESSFYHTIMWVKEDKGWTLVNNTESYKTKEEFIKAIEEAEEFSQAYREYMINV